MEVFHPQSAKNSFSQGAKDIELQASSFKQISFSLLSNSIHTFVGCSL